MSSFVKRCSDLLRGKRVRFLSPAKINLYLDIVGIREDGYHLIESLFVPVSIFDQLYVRLNKEGRISVACDSEWFNDKENSVVKAYDIFTEATGLDIGLNVSIKKIIPPGSGMGGASSNAALVLRILNHLQKRVSGDSLSEDSLLRLAISVGADVPFFLTNLPAFIGGIGERVRPVRLRGDLNLVAVYPSVPFYTARMYREFDRLNRLTKVVKSDRRFPPFLGLGSISDSVFNVFESVLRGKNLRMVMDLKRRFFMLGAVASALSGSGSTVFGLFKNRGDARSAFERLSKEFPDYRVFSARVLKGGEVA